MEDRQAQQAINTKAAERLDNIKLATADKFDQLMLLLHTRLPLIQTTQNSTTILIDETLVPVKATIQEDRGIGKKDKKLKTPMTPLRGLHTHIDTPSNGDSSRNQIN